MNSEEAIATAEKLLGRGLTNVQELVSRQAWSGKSYECIADCSGYDTGYLKDVGAKLWRSLSEASGQRTTKSNFHGLIERYRWRQQIKSDFALAPGISPPQSCNIPIDNAPFYDRTAELATLSQWILQDRCRSIAILGLGGIGKTCLAATLAMQLCDRFEFVIWRSLRSAPAPTEFLHCLLKELALGMGNDSFPTEIDAQIDRLLLHLRQYRCLIVLDNLESVLRDNHIRRHYREGYEGYGQLIRCVAGNTHQGCLLFTSRERPIGLSMLTDPRGVVRALPLRGLSLEACQHLLNDRGLERSPWETEQLVSRYGGNPLALKIAAASIHSLFAGSAGDFLQQDIAVFGDIWDLLDRQFERLCPLERRLMYWLALQAGSTTLTELQAQLRSIPRHFLFGVLDSLQGRSLVETSPTGIAQPGIVAEYVSIRFIDRCGYEILEGAPEVLSWQPLPAAQCEDSADNARAASILQPIVAQLAIALGDVACIEARLNDLLEQSRKTATPIGGYTDKNITALLTYLKNSARAR